MIENMNTIIQNAITAKKEKLSNQLDLVLEFKNALLENFDLMQGATKIDLIKHNGFYLEEQKINTIFDRYKDISPLINHNDGTDLTKGNSLKNMVYSSKGIIQVIFDKDTYALIELIILGLLTNNVIIFSNEGYMLGTNKFIISLLEAILEKYNLSKYRFLYSSSIKPEDYFEHFKTISQTIIVGDHYLQNKYCKLCKGEVLTSGYNHYDIYIDDDKHLDMVNKLLELNENYNIYIKESINCNISGGTIVQDIDEAIAQINYNGSGYSATIFTLSNDNASDFIRRVNSKNINVNISPLLNSDLDIKEKDLLSEKNILINNIYKFDGTNVNVPINYT